MLGSTRWVKTVAGGGLAVLLGVALVASLTPALSGGGQRADDAAEAEELVAFGFIRGVDGDRLLFDEAQWLTGDDAAAAAAADGVIAPGEQVPNDYYIANPDPTVHRLPVAEHAEIIMTFWRGEPGQATRIDLATLAGFFEPEALPEDAAAAGSPYWLVLVDGEVIAVEQQYLP